MAESKSTLNIEDEMRSSFLDYAMSVIIARALPDVRDGLKPVHRRILYAMHQLKNHHAQPYKKSARVVGDVIGKYHPHGDSAVYDALVRLAQDFAMRYPLVDGQGNFGSIDGDSAAAMRYTEVRMQRLTSELLTDLEKETVDWVPNYDEKELEPAVLPTKVPNLLLNGAVGIAVGMATNIPPHNLTELLDATIALIDDPQLPVSELLGFVKGPDFPTGGVILGTAGIKQAYLEGRGSVTVRARCEIEEDKKGRESIVVTEIPYQVNKTRLIERIASLVRDKKIEGIADIQDYSDRTGMRIWISVKKDHAAQIVLNKLYKMSDLQTSFGVNMIAIVNGRPEVLTLEKCLRHFIDHRRTVVTRRCRFDLAKAMARREIVEGLGVAVDSIDRVIELIRSSRDPDEARAKLMAEPLEGFAKFLRRCDRPAEEVARAEEGPYRLNERQAKAILDMRLQRLTGLERDKVEGEYRELCEIIAELEAILTNPAKLMAVIREELLTIRYTYGDPEGQDSGTGAEGSKGSRRTELAVDELEIQPIDLVADESMVVMITREGYVKRMPTTEYRVQNRGGVGLKSGSQRDDDDQIIELFEASAHAWILLFTNTGRVFRKRVFEFPLGTRGQRPKAMVNFLDLKDGERVLEMVAYREEEVDENHFVVLASAQGYIKRTSLQDFTNIRASGLIAASVAEDDKLIDAKLTNGSCDIIMASREGQAIRFDEADVRRMGRTARGVRGMGLRDGDEVVNILVLAREGEDDIGLLTVCEKGYGKRTPVAEYRRQSRAGLGLKTIKVSDRNGKVVGMIKVREADQLMVVTSEGKIIRTPVAGISELGRATQGVRLIRLGDDEVVVGLARIDDPGADEDDLEALEGVAGEDGEGAAQASADADTDEGEGADEQDGADADADADADEPESEEE
ncbi:DNA gyrase subunit A [Pseudenhygromyxa sp. WMMC2535]|uniref:DNA gyrase subunit A n=1 Tax=Pseudenhygromyxa sp. WMMC2535 TaxID=2712867 RepID=UPI00155441AD|nr:DNA gyrase subunit A [Pseudenhygromyxa sp. WMMC2535]NVB42693.1 DNA gyrase subunit A [Pseudenhygromyxa sp. WMMC2535]